MILSNLKKVMEDYKPDESIWREYDDEMLWFKRALEDLSDSDRIIFVLYTEYGSYRKVGRILNVSHSIIYKNITRIKKQMYDYIKTNIDNDNSVFLDRLKRVCGDSEEVDMEVTEGERQTI